MMWHFDLGIAVLVIAWARDSVAGPALRGQPHEHQKSGASFVDERTHSQMWTGDFEDYAGIGDEDEMRDLKVSGVVTMESDDADAALVGGQQSHIETKNVRGFEMPVGQHFIDTFTGHSKSKASSLSRVGFGRRHGRLWTSGHGHYGGALHRSSDTSLRRRRLAPRPVSRRRRTPAGHGASLRRRSAPRPVTRRRRARPGV